jgi:hypothetical protein
MIEEVEKAAKILGMGYEWKEGPGTDGKQVRFLLLNFGFGYKIACSEGQNSVILETAVMIKPEDAEAIAIDANRQKRLLRVLKLELLNGRTGYRFEMEKDQLRAIVLSQRLILLSDRESGLQRFWDGLQELVIMVARCLELLGAVLGDMRTAPPLKQSTSPEMMYR